MKGTRLDVYLAENGFADSREKAKALIMEGLVYINGMKAAKAGDTVPESAEITVRGGQEFVSRGGHKLKKAVSSFGLDLSGLSCADIGASTGGFTDCMLQNGAAKVCCIDVGYGQLAWKLRSDPRVTNFERTNIRYFDVSLLDSPIDFASIDTSFISLSLVLPKAFEMLAPGGEVVALIKPQFEAGKDKVGKNGVVRDPGTHKEVILQAASYAKDTGFAILGLDYSPIKGPEGNIEYLIHLKKPDGDTDGHTLTDEDLEILAETTVNRSHKELDKQ